MLISTWQIFFASNQSIEGDLLVRQILVLNVVANHIRLFCYPELKTRWNVEKSFLDLTLIFAWAFFSTLVKPSNFVAPSASANKIHWPRALNTPWPTETIVKFKSKSNEFVLPFEQHHLYLDWHLKLTLEQHQFHIEHYIAKQSNNQIEWINQSHQWQISLHWFCLDFHHQQ